MHVGQFDFDLPEELVALRPVQPDIRGRSVGVREVARRLLVEMGPDDVLVSGHLEHLAWYAPELRAQMVQPRTPATAAAWLAAFDASAYPAVYVYPWTPGWTKPLTDWSRAQGAEAIGPRSARIWRIVSD